jgi:tRNA nucleotidyltransferase/poly(A) polymerase
LGGSHSDKKTQGACLKTAPLNLSFLFNYDSFIVATGQCPVIVVYIMQIPDFVKNIIEKLEKGGFEAYIVGGCVRDLLLGAVCGEFVEPKDWDVTTNARPEQILKIFSEGKYENVFGTVIVPISPTTDNRQPTTDKKVAVEVTTYRSEQDYSDRRHPDTVVFEDNIENDLSRRDFTINAMAMKITDNRQPTTDNKTDKRSAIRDTRYEIIDLFGGQKDLKKK